MCTCADRWSTYLHRTKYAPPPPPPNTRALACRLEKIAAKPKEGDFWQADHIQAVCEGGGECDLDNYRTLCTPCHMKVTGELRPGE
jgi:hypothetical protein